LQHPLHLAVRGGAVLLGRGVEVEAKLRLSPDVEQLPVLVEEGCRLVV